MTKAIASAWLTTLMLTACGGEQSSSGSTAATAARKVWTDKCAVCHGEDGKGQGPGAMALNPKPRSFTDPKWQTYTADDRITKVIVEGGSAVGLSDVMPPNPDLQDKPEVVAELVALIRAFG